MNDTDRAARLQALTDLLYEAAAEAGVEEPGGARILAETEALHSGSAVIVCVGEKKRGKSSLINALTGCPGLLPVDIDVASSVHVLVRYGERPEALVHRGPEGGPSRAEPVPLERIAEFAALDPGPSWPGTRMSATWTCRCPRRSSARAWSSSTRPEWVVSSPGTRSSRWPRCDAPTPCCSSSTAPAS